MATFFPYVHDESLRKPSSASSASPGGFEAFAAEGVEGASSHAEGVEGASSQAEVPETVTFKRTLWIQGGHHICDGATSKLTDEMEQFETFRSQLQVIREWFSKNDNREFFVQTFLLPQGGLRYAPLFKNKPPTILEIRWGSLLGVVGWVLEREHVLRAYWSEKRMQLDNKNRPQCRRKQEQHDKELVKGQKLSSLIQSPFFWAFGLQLQLLGKVVTSVDDFFDSCMCHSRLNEIVGNFGVRGSWWMRNKALAGDCNREQGRSICPLRGCVAPLLAAGIVDEFLQLLLKKAYNELLVVYKDLDPSEWKILVSNFNAGKSHLILWFQMKLGCWKVLPYVSAVLGHPDASVSRSTLAVALQQFDGAGPAQKAGGVRHPLSIELFGEGEMREQLLLFLGGAPLESLPELHIMAAKMMVIPVSERSIESRHRDVAQSHRAAPSTSPQLVSWSVRSREWLTRIDADPAFLVDLSEIANQFRSPMQGLLEFGLAGYPAVMESMNNSKNWRKVSAKVLALLLFHCDLDTLYVRQSESDKKRKAIVQRGNMKKKRCHSRCNANEPKPGGPGPKVQAEETQPTAKGPSAKKSKGVKAVNELIRLQASSGSHLPNLVPAAATRFLQHLSDTSSWYSISQDLLEAGGLEDLDSRLQPCVEELTGKMAAVTMPEILEGLSAEEATELQEVVMPLFTTGLQPSGAGAAGAGGFDSFYNNQGPSASEPEASTTEHASVEAEGVPHTMFKVIAQKWNGHMTNTDNDTVGVDSFDLLVTTHAAYRVGDGIVLDLQAQANSSSAARAGALKVLTIPKVDLAMLRRSILKWEENTSEPESELFFSILGNIPEASLLARQELLNVTKDLVQATNWKRKSQDEEADREGYVVHDPGMGCDSWRPEALISDRLSALHLLARHDFAKCVGRDTVLQLSTWALTQRGREALVAGVHLHNPKFVMQHRESQAVQDMMDYELLEYLDQEGWRCVTLPHGFRKNRLPLLDLKKLAAGDESKKMWFLRQTATALDDAYLKVLASWKQLEASGVLVLKHVEDSKSYQQLLDPNYKPRTRRKQLAIGDTKGPVHLDDTGIVGGFLALEGPQGEGDGGGEAGRRPKHRQKGAKGGKDGLQPVGDEDEESESEDLEEEEEEEDLEEPEDLEEEEEEPRVCTLEEDAIEEEYRKWGEDSFEDSIEKEDSIDDDLPLAKLGGFRLENDGLHPARAQGNEEEESEEREDEDSTGESSSSDETSSSSSRSSSSESSDGTLPPKGGLAEPPNLPKAEAKSHKKARGKRSKPYGHDVRNGRWGSFYFSHVEGPNWDAFSVECPVHKGNGHKCTRQASWHKPVGAAWTKAARREQKNTILGLMQWCACVGNGEIKDELGHEGKAAHVKYMKLKTERKRDLKSEEEIKAWRLSHGHSDDEGYTPLCALAQPEPGESDSD